MTPKINYVITESEWDDNFDEVSAINNCRLIKGCNNSSGHDLTDGACIIYAYLTLVVWLK